MSRKKQREKPKRENNYIKEVFENGMRVAKGHQRPIN